MLHVLNGDAMRGALEQSGVGGEITVWADVLHDGPVPDVPPARLRAARAAYLAALSGETEEQVRREFDRWDALERYDCHEEVIFWLEHDLFDQMLLLRHLHWLSGIDHGSTRFTLIGHDEYLGPLPPDRLRALFDTRQVITPAQIAAGREGWNLFRAPDPTGLVAWSAGQAAAMLRFMPAALMRLFEEFPWTRDGLSRTERQALNAASEGAVRLHDAFVASQRMEDPFFMGDLGFWDVVRRLWNVPHPLVTVTPPLDGMPSGDERVELTEAGRHVLAGEVDHVALNGIDRWIGGVYLTPANCWRWTGATLVA